MSTEQATKEKVPVSGWIVLALLIILFSGVFQNNEGPLKAFDFNNLNGKFGTIAESKNNFTGSGGKGAREGFTFTLTLIPGTCFACGLIEVTEGMGGMKAAEALFTPLLRPVLGIPGICGIAFVASFTSSDIASFSTKQLYEQGLITDDERTIFVAYQYAGSAVISNTINTQAPLLPISLLAFGPILLIELFCKIMGANIVRLITKANSKKGAK